MSPIVMFESNNITSINYSKLFIYSYNSKVKRIELGFFFDAR